MARVQVRIAQHIRRVRVPPAGMGAWIGALTDYARIKRVLESFQGRLRFFRSLDHSSVLKSLSACILDGRFSGRK